MTDKTTKNKIIQTIMATIIIIGGVLVIYQPIKDGIEIKSELALRRSELALTKLELADLNETLETKKLIEFNKNLIKKNEDNSQIIKILKEENKQHTNRVEHLEHNISKKSKHFDIYGIWYGQLEGDKIYKLNFDRRLGKLRIDAPMLSRIISLDNEIFHNDILSFSYDTWGTNTIKVTLKRITDDKFLGEADVPNKGILKYKLIRKKN